MKILIVAAANSLHTVKWVNALAEKEHDVYLAYNNDHIPNQKINNNVILIKLKYNSPQGYYLNAKELSEKVKEISPDVINAHYASGYGTLVRKAKVHPVLLSVLGSDVYDFPFESKLKHNIFIKNISFADGLASTSECMARKLREVCLNDALNVEITPFGVNTNLFNPNNFVRQKNDKITIGNVKALESNYGIIELIKAIEQLLLMTNNTLMNKITVEIYGDGSQFSKLNDYITNRGLDKIVKLKGWIPNSQVPEALANLDIFCITSKKESFGVSVVEAMAMELPVVATDTDGFIEVIGDTDEIVVPVDDIRSIALGLKRFIDNPCMRKQYGKDGRKHVIEKYNEELCIKKMEYVLLKTFNNSKMGLGK